ncbi:MAG: hypothetical protein ACJAT4_001999 [Granulosicoccus sp.]
MDVLSIVLFLLKKKNQKILDEKIAKHKASSCSLIFILQSLFDSTNQATQNPRPLLTSHGFPSNLRLLEKNKT